MTAMTGTSWSDLAGIVTGAGSGIGKAVASHLASLGANVLAVDYNGDSVNALAAATDHVPGTIVPYHADVTDPQQVQAYAKHADDLFDRLWFFHNNAGVEGVHKNIEDIEVAEWASVMNINLNSFFYGLKYVLPSMKRRGGGAVVITGSLLSFKGAPTRSDYTATKHAVLGLARTAAVECAPAGVKVNCICPGPIETPLMTRSERLSNEDDPGEERRRFLQNTPIGRYGQPEEVAQTVAFLLSASQHPILAGVGASGTAGVGH